ncbi:MAG: efflux RND transporter periplasmic adaptor subunit [Acidobacteriota bacterium]
MPVDINSEMTTPSNDYPGASTPHITPHPDPAHALPAPSRSQRGITILVSVVALLIVAGIAYRLIARASDQRHLAKVTDQSAIPSVAITFPAVSTGGDPISLPGNTQAFDDTPIYARTSGYVKKWFVDLGQHVRKGELMATIETPELDQQLQAAEADLKTAQANLNLADITSKRYQNLLKLDSVSKQETDVAVSGAAAREAAVNAAEANVRRLQQMQSFENVYAPYSGVVTARNTDIGDLIDAGSPSTSSTAKELFHIASVNQLRVFVAVPEVYAPDIHTGDKATLTLDEYPGQTFTGTVARNSNSIDMASRTLNVEVDVQNPNGKLLPGAYVFVHFKLPQGQQMLSVPSNTLLFRSEGLRVALVQNGHVHLQPIVIGKDNGRTVEIATGLTAHDQVILDPSDSVAEGQSVEISNHPAVQ